LHEAANADFLSCEIREKERKNDAEEENEILEKAGNKAQERIKLRSIILKPAE
jgi:hypothetical protein